MSLKKWLVYKDGELDEEASIKSIKKRYPKDDDLDAVERIMKDEERDLKKKYGKKYDPKIHGGDQ